MRLKIVDRDDRNLITANFGGGSRKNSIPAPLKGRERIQQLPACIIWKPIFQRHASNHAMVLGSVDR